jgi:hypothetical protein
MPCLFARIFALFIRILPYLLGSLPYILCRQDICHVCAYEILLMVNLLLIMTIEPMVLLVHALLLLSLIWVPLIYILDN